MSVRGAPAIAILAVLSIAVDINNPEVVSELNENKCSLLSRVRRQCQYLCTSRPTAVNISKECQQLIALAERLAEDSSVTFGSMLERLTRYANDLLEIDINTNKSIGDLGAQHIIALNGTTQLKNVLTHCNTGSLATGLTTYLLALRTPLTDWFSYCRAAGYGTALGVIRSLHNMNALSQAVSV